MDEIDTPEARARLESLFPNLPKVGYQITSPVDMTHNCIAYAAGDLRRKWQPESKGTLTKYYWPPDAKKGTGIHSLIYAYEAIGFVDCGKDASYEEGFDKVVIYMNEKGGWSHAARLNEDNTWSSKIGNLEDIRHNSPYAFQGHGGYGEVFCFMKRGTLRDDSERETEAYE